MLVGNNELAITKNAGELLAILIAMRMWRYDVGHITRWSTSRASLEATGCRHWASARIALPRQPPWSTISVENTKH
jgi:hypothetical protein